ncbi:hypothetical protein KC315_g29 [Hortaea werneckii]|nr:hypothetical protein KC315_g29 [Hortaea werneckii]
MTCGAADGCAVENWLCYSIRAHEVHFLLQKAFSLLETRQGPAMPAHFAPALSEQLRSGLALASAPCAEVPARSRLTAKYP